MNKECSIKDLLKLLEEQAKFTEALRKSAIEAMAYVGHVNANYALDVPDDLLRKMAHAKMSFDIMSIQPAPVVRGLSN